MIKFHGPMWKYTTTVKTRILFSWSYVFSILYSYYFVSCMPFFVMASFIVRMIRSTIVIMTLFTIWIRATIWSFIEFVDWFNYTTFRTFFILRFGIKRPIPNQHPVPKTGAWPLGYDSIWATWLASQAYSARPSWRTSVRYVIAGHVRPRILNRRKEWESNPRGFYTRPFSKRLRLTNLRRLSIESYSFERSNRSTPQLSQKWVPRSRNTVFGSFGRALKSASSKQSAQPIQPLDLFTYASIHPPVLTN